MKSSARGFMFLLLGVVGAVIAIAVIDLGITFYYEQKIKKDTTEVLEVLVEHDYFETNEQYRELAKSKFKEMKYEDLTQVSVVVRDDGAIILTNYVRFFTLKGTVLNKPDRMAGIRIIAYKNEYSEWQFEVYDEEKTYVSHIENNPEA